LLALAASFVARGQRLARLQAVESLHEFDEEMKTVQVLLYGRNADRQQLDEGLARARAALARYGVLEDSAWREAPAVRHLPAEARSRLGDSLGELLFLLARHTVQLARSDSDPSRRSEEYRAALRYNVLAQTCFGADSIPRALWEQRAELVRQLGDEKEADALGARARQAPLRLDKDYYLLAHSHVLQGNYRLALGPLETATQLDPQSFSAWFVRGNCYYELQRNSDAVTCYSICISLRPSFPWTWLNRGLAFLRLHQDREACADFDRVLGLNGQRMDAYLNRALARENLRQYPAALADLNRALEIGPACSRIWYRLARVRGKAGDKEGAKRDLDRCKGSQPADEHDWIARALARKNLDPMGALADLDRALALNPRSFEGLQNKAALLSDKLSRDDEALQVLEEAVRCYPDSVLARGGRGILLARQGKRNQAVADAREALLLDPSPRTQYQVAGIYAQTSRHNAADRVQALHLLSSALRAGASLDRVKDDHDLDPLREDAEFQRVLAAARALDGRVPQEAPR
jgi:tetratricopeptide (TPR) repeat protein